MTIMPPLRLVVIESPYRATQERSQEQHRAYLLHCLADSIGRGENPYASHHLLTEVLNDDVPMERALGIQAGWSWGAHADAVAVYRDLGISPGMAASIEHYKVLGKPIEYRSIDQRLVLAVCG